MTDLSVDPEPTHDAEGEHAELWSYEVGGDTLWAWSCQHGHHYAGFASGREAAQHLTDGLGADRE